MVDDMAVYIANLGKYNEGCLVGAWFTFPIDEEDVKAVSYTHLDVYKRQLQAFVIRRYSAKTFFQDNSIETIVYQKN